MPAKRVAPLESDFNRELLSLLHDQARSSANMPRSPRPLTRLTKLFWHVQGYTEDSEEGLSISESPGCVSGDETL